MKKILISGAGITGLSLAYWLEKAGFRPTLIDRAPSPRPAPDIVHVMGPGYRVLEKMGLIGMIRGMGLDLREIEFVDSAHTVLGRVPLQALRDRLDNRVCHVPRSELEAALREVLADRILIRQGSSIRRLGPQPEGVSVLFEDHDWEQYDLVIGADGLHSNVRRLAFGKDERYARFCGYHLATFSIDSLKAEGRVLCAVSRDRYAGIFGRGGHVTAFFLFRGLAYPEAAGADAKSQKRIVRQAFGDAGWECPTLLDSMDASPDFRFSAVEQIRMDSWSQGRVVLAGDAAYCPSLFSGQGASLALSGAYVLAGELRRAEGDPTRALAAYEKRLRPAVEKKQVRGSGLPIFSSGRMGSWVNLKLCAWLGNPLVAKAIAMKRFADEAVLADI